MDLYVNGRYAARWVTGVERYAAETTRVLGPRARKLAPPAGMGGISGHLWEQAVLPRLLPENGLLWSPANTGPLRVERQVVTVHDVAPVDHPEWYQGPFARWYRWLLPRLAGRVRAVIAVSDFTRRRLIAMGVAEEKIFVVRPGIAPRFGVASDSACRRVRERYALPARYILSVGTLEPRKNLLRLWHAWGRVASAFPDVGMAVVGSPGRAFRKIDLRAIPARTSLLGRVPDDDLDPLYAGAEAFVMVSLYEGFGLTPLEAMASGVPCLVSQAGGVAEAVGDAALRVDPQDERGIEAGLLRILGDHDLRERLREKGLERARSLRWEETAQGVWDVCQKVGG